MFDKKYGTEQASSAPETLSTLRDKAHVYLVHAAVLDSARHAAASDASLLQKLVRRRLVRLERVVAALGGSVVRQMPRGLLASFETADAAVIGACEMQRRCSVIPQIFETQIALKIGIQAAVAATGAGDAIDYAAMMARWFAGMLDEGCIVVSSTLVDELSPALRETVSLPIDAGIDVAAHAIDWQRVPLLRLPSPAPQAAADAQPRRAPASDTIVLAFDMKEGGA